MSTSLTLRGSVVAGLAVAVVLSGTALTVASTPTTPRAASVTYSVDRPLCPTTVKPGHVTCFAMQRVTVKKGTPGAQPDAVNLPGYTPAELASAYQYDPAINRSNQTVAIIGWFNDPNILSDLNTFDTANSLPAETATSLRVVNESGNASPLPSSLLGKADAAETALQVEAVRGVCNTCHILLVEAPRPTDVFIAAAENSAARLGATEITNSFGGPETDLPSYMLSAFNHPGIVITAATGDHGWFGWGTSNGFTSPVLEQAQFPASDPNVVSVGGTNLHINRTTGAKIAETVWDSDGPDDKDYTGQDSDLGVTGGGCSQVFTAASWQSAYPGYSAANCAGKRLSADVAAIGSPANGLAVYNSYGQGTHGWLKAGGTSLSSAVVAAMFALAGGSGGATYPAFSMYNNAASTPSLVTDVTQGGNSWCGGDTLDNCSDAAFGDSQGQFETPNQSIIGILDCTFPRDPNTTPTEVPLSSECNATTGYDGPSGIGAPFGSALFASTSPAISLAGPAIPRLHRAAKFTAGVTDPLTGAEITTATYNWGDGTSGTPPILTSPTTPHTYVKAGTYDVSLTVADSAGQESIVHRSITVGEPLRALLTAPKTASHRRRVAFHAAVADPNTGGVIRTISWNWGDHHTSTGASVGHVWVKAGHYTIKVTMTDNTGLKAVRTVHITIT